MGKTFQSYLPWFGGSILLAVMFVLFFLRPPSVDPVTYCPETDQETGNTVIIVDVSDELTLSQRKSLEKELKEISSTSEKRPSYLNKGERLSVYFMEEEGVEPLKIFDLCNPGNPSERSHLEKFSEGRLYALNRWNKFSGKVLTTVEEKFKFAEDEDSSPILETISIVRWKEFLPRDLLSDELSSKGRYRIIIWSDMIQHSTIESHYKSHGNIRAVMKKNPMELDGITVFVYYLSSRKYSRFQGVKHTFWWRSLLSLAGAELSAWEDA